MDFIISRETLLTIAQSLLVILFLFWGCPKVYNTWKKSRRIRAGMSRLEIRDDLASKIEKLTKHKNLNYDHPKGHLAILKKTRFDSVYKYKLYELLKPKENLFMGEVDFQEIYDGLIGITVVDTIRFKYDREE